MKTPILFDDIPMYIRERIYSDIGEASMCWESPEGVGVFDSQKAAKIGFELCQFILDQIAAKEDVSLKAIYLLCSE